MDWTPEQYEQLTERYRSMPDGGLLRLAAAPDDLTEIAEEVLKNEMDRRGLALEEETAPAPPREPLKGERTHEENQLWYDYALKAPSHCTFHFPTVKQANDAYAFLQEAGIDSQVGSTSGDLDLRGPRVVVRPRDAEEAAAILSTPVPERITDEPEVEPEDFYTPACPLCSAADPLLESVDPVNHWRCEACDHQWSDPA